MAAVLVTLGCCLPLSLRAQSTTRVLPVEGADVMALTRDQEHLLVLQLLGCTPLINITARPYTLSALNDLLAPLASSRCADTARLVPMGISGSRVSAGSVFNTGSASEIPGAVWAGRGLTLFARGGGVARYGVFSFALRPVAFWTQNRSFTAPLDSTSGFRNPAYPTAIDLPWRFGDKSYARFDPGESWIELDTRSFAAGLSTATQEWGPMHEFPLLMGPNAGGFPHIFAGSSVPWNVGIGRLAARMILGRLDPSAFAPQREGSKHRLGPGLVASFVPEFFRNVEIGGGRFFHRRWPDDGIDLSVLKVPFEGFLKAHEEGAVDVPDNQLASAYVRLVSPEKHVEVYGEYLRDDHNRDARDLALEPDHESSFAVGVRKAWIQSSGAVNALTLESVNARLTHLVRVRSESPMYVHEDVSEGHTERGKLLGSPAAFGGSGLAIVFARYTVSGEWKVALRSEGSAQNNEGGRWNGLHVGANEIEASRMFRTSRAEYTIGAAARANWDDVQGPNNLSLVFGVRPRW